MDLATPSPRILDVSNNMIQFLPDETFWARLEHLSSLNLEKNRFGKFSAISGLIRVPSLRLLNVRSTPLSGQPKYRLTILSRLESLIALDGAVVTDEDIMVVKAGSRMELHQLKYRMRREWIVPDATQHIEESTLDELVVAFTAEMDKWHRLNSSRRPSLAIQRVVRGHRGRLIFRERKDYILPCVIKIQRWLLKCWFRRVAVLELCASNLQGARSTERVKQCLECMEADPLPQSDAFLQKRLYFLPSDAPTLCTLLHVASRMYPDGTAPVPHISRVALLGSKGRPEIWRVSSGHTSRSPMPGGISITIHKKIADIGSDAPAGQPPHAGKGEASIGSAMKSPFPRGLVARLHHADRTLEDAAAIVGWRSMHMTGPPQRRRGLAVISRRGCSVRKSEIYRFSSKWHEGERNAENMNRMVVVTFASQRSAQSFLSLIALLNANEIVGLPEQFCVVIPGALSRACAATAIQAAVRAFNSGRRMRPPIFSAVLAMRAVRCIQSWWRFLYIRSASLPFQTLCLLHKP